MFVINIRRAIVEEAIGVQVFVAVVVISRTVKSCASRFGDDEDLARCMLDLIGNKAERKQLADNASRFVERIDWNAKQGEYLDLVDSLAAVGPQNG